VIEANELLLRSWERARAADGSKPRYGNRAALQALEAHAGGRPLDELSRADIQGWVASMGEKVTPSTRRTYFGAARAFYNWASSEEEAVIGKSPMARMAQPPDPMPPAPFPTVEEVTRLIGAAEADKSPMGIRDAAMLRIMCDTGGPRASEVAGMLIAGRPGVPAGMGLDLQRDVVGVIGKNDKYRQFTISPKTGRACARWARQRDRLPRAAGHPRVWIGFRSNGRPVTREAVAGIVERRCREAGITATSPHLLRHFAFHHFLVAGGGESDAMMLFGWDDATMPRRYARALASERALKTGFALAIGNQW
jgi:integrase/recombinase XerC